MNIIHSFAKSFFLKIFKTALILILLIFISPPPDVGPTIHTAGAVGSGIYQGDACLVPQAIVSMETENQDPDGEEKIVYL